MKSIEGKILGKKVKLPNKYTPSVLVAVPRKYNREKYYIDDHQLPFIGYDIWHAYEFSFLTNKGLPVTGVLKLSYPATSHSLIESKSLKLYLNGFNMEKYGENPEDGLKKILDIINRDLTKLLQGEVNLKLHDNTISNSNNYDFNNYELLEADPKIKQSYFDSYTEAPELLKLSNETKSEIKVASHLLRSKCKITDQPDWGSVFIFMKGEKLPDKSSLLKYLVSFRNENHFHEEVCEMIYKRLWDIFSPDKLMVSCVYTRRGGIDICPVRANHQSLLPKFLSNVEELSQKLLRQ